MAWTAGMCDRPAQTGRMIGYEHDMHAQKIRSTLVLEDGETFEGYAFGGGVSVAGEVVFNTGMVGYPESLTDPSYAGEILVFTYPLMGNYGIPRERNGHDLGSPFESARIQIRGLVVSEHSIEYSHWNAAMSLDDWLREAGIPGLYGVDTRMLTKRLREKGTMLGKVLVSGDDLPFYDPGADNLVAAVSVREPIQYAGTGPRVVILDCGCKTSIVRSVVERGATVTRVPWNYDLANEEFDGLIISNGPGDPKQCQETVAIVKQVIQRDKPILGICLGNQILALASGADTYKLKYGHRSQNQPCREVGTSRCYITSQNHGYAVRPETLDDEWEPWFVNANDGTNEGIRHRSRPLMSIQFHPEAAPGPYDTEYLFDQFLSVL